MNIQPSFKCTRVVALLALLHLTACSLQTGSGIKEHECTLLHSLTEYPDSTFFSEISCLYHHKGKLYAFDQARGDVAVWNGTDSDSTFYTVGTHGEGPEELAYPVTFYPIGDTIAILDGGTLSIKYFDKTGFIRARDVTAYTNDRFFIEDDTVYMTSLTDSTCYAKIPGSWTRRDSLQNIVLCGNMLHITDRKGSNMSRNVRKMVKGADGLYAVCRSYHVVEKYDLHTNALLESYDLTAIPYIKSVVNYIKNENLPENTEAIFIRDAYWHNGLLYLLCADWNNGYAVNTVVALSDNGGLAPYAMYHLTPERAYNTIAVSDSCLYAADDKNGKNSIDTYRLPR